MLPQPPLWLTLVAFLCLLGPLVFFHELGHYSVARLFGIPAETFSIGFGKELFGWTDRQGTRWKVAWLPLGGYVKFVGDMTPASDPADLEDIPRAFARTDVPGSPGLAAVPGRSRRAGCEFSPRNPDLRVIFRDIRDSLDQQPRRQVQSGSAAAAAGIKPGDQILHDRRTSTQSFEDIADVVIRAPAKGRSLSSSAAAKCCSSRSQSSRRACGTVGAKPTRSAPSRSARGRASLCEGAATAADSGRRRTR